MARSTFATVAEYLATHPPAARATLQRVRATVRKALPKASEGISYQILVYKLDGWMVLYVAGFAAHYSIYPATARLIAELGDEIGDHLHGRATLRFSYDERFPAKLITRIAKARAAEALERGAVKLSKKNTKKNAKKK
jgi:uncharacterized protein YdhG (YjbR/CyaY superfamily)